MIETENNDHSLNIKNIIGWAGGVYIDTLFLIVEGEMSANERDKFKSWGYDTSKVTVI